jgi:Organic solute transporter Ostalpha
MKIATLIPAYAIISFIAVCSPKSYVYLDPWLDVFQSVALGYFFLLLCEFVSPSREQRDLFFAALQVKDKKAPGGVGGGMKWYRVSLLSARLKFLTYCRDDGSCSFNIL